jgi:Ni/Fe-hydrogenase subunit HybB-like protein
LNVTAIRVASVLSLIGIVLNRLNVSIIAFKWNSPMHYYPSWQEVVITLAIIFIEIWVFRWVVNRMPVLRAFPAWAVEGRGIRPGSIPERRFPREWGEQVGESPLVDRP